MTVSGTVVLAPHPDDAAFSIGGALAIGALRKPVTLITIFGRSNFGDGAFQLDTDAITGQRAKEDAEYCRHLGIRLDWMGLDEASLRFGASLQQVFVKQYTDVEAPEDFIHLLKDRIDRLQPALVYVPLGLGKHKDHLTVVRAIQYIPVLKDRVIYYEDLPYAQRLGEGEIRLRARSLSPQCEPIIFDLGKEGLQRKMLGASIYKSQLDARTAMAIRDHAGCIVSGGAGERLWMSGALSLSE